MYAYSHVKNLLAFDRLVKNNDCEVMFIYYAFILAWVKYSTTRCAFQYYNNHYKLIIFCKFLRSVAFINFVSLFQLGLRRIHVVRTRGGNLKYRALRLEGGNFAWGSECKFLIILLHFYSNIFHSCSFIALGGCDNYSVVFSLLWSYSQWWQQCLSFNKM